MGQKNPQVPEWVGAVKTAVVAKGEPRMVRKDSYVHDAIGYGDARENSYVRLCSLYFIDHTAGRFWVGKKDLDPLDSMAFELLYRGEREPPSSFKFDMRAAWPALYRKSLSFLYGPIVNDQDLLDAKLSTKFSRLLKYLFDKEAISQVPANGAEGVRYYLSEDDRKKIVTIE